MLEILRMTLLASTPDAKKVGIQVGSEYQRVLAAWAWRLRTVERVSAKMKAEWSRDLRAALETDLTSALLEQAASRWINAGIELPAPATVRRFATIAVRKALGPEAEDLLGRFQDAASETNNRLPVDAYLNPNKTAQTTAQIYDMAADSFNESIARRAAADNQLTGRKRWQTTGGAASRHANLQGQIRTLRQAFDDAGRQIQGPRPTGGHPNHWSNCSCRLQYETSDGNWISL